MAIRVNRLKQLETGDWLLPVIMPFTATFVSSTINPSTGLAPGDQDDVTKYIVPGDTVAKTTWNEYYSGWKDVTSPSKPLVKGTAAVVLMPGLDENWIQNLKGTTYKDAAGSADTASGTFIPENVVSYYCNRASITFTPTATAVTMNDILDEAKTSYVNTVKDLPQTVASEGTHAEQVAQKQPQRRSGRSTVKGATQDDDRNANVTENGQTTYGTLVRRKVNATAGGNGTTSIPYVLLSYPASYEGVIEYSVSYIRDPNTIWSFKDTDLMSGPEMWIVRNIDIGRTFSIDMPLAVPVKGSITEGEKTVLDVSKQYTNVNDRNMSWGAFLIKVQDPYIDAVLETYPVTKGEGETATTSYVLSPKGVLHGYVKYDLVLKMK